MDITELNERITRKEVENAVYRTKLNKTVGIEVLRNSVYIDMLYRIIDYCFEHGSVPSVWRQSIITPIPKSDTNPRVSLSYRGISLISVPCKVYADILNTRLSNYLELNNILFDEQNGFR